MNTENKCIICHEDTGNNVFTVCDNCWIISRENTESIIKKNEDYQDKLIKYEIMNGEQKEKIKKLKLQLKQKNAEIEADTLTLKHYQAELAALQSKYRRLIGDLKLNYERHSNLSKTDLENILQEHK